MKQLKSMDPTLLALIWQKARVKGSKDTVFKALNQNWKVKWLYYKAWVAIPDKGYNADDFFQWARTICFSALHTFDSERKVQFTSYLAWCLKPCVNYFCDNEANLIKPRTNWKDKMAKAKIKPGDYPAFTSIAPTSVDRKALNPFLNTEVKMDAYKYLGVLDDKDRDLLEQRYGLNGRAQKTNKEIGESLGLTKQAISLRANEALFKCRVGVN